MADTTRSVELNVYVSWDTTTSALTEEKAARLVEDVVQYQFEELEAFVTVERVEERDEAPEG